jgi:hypothetical protein
MLKALIESAVIQNGKVTVPLTMVLVAASGWILWKINRFDPKIKSLYGATKRASLMWDRALVKAGA